MKLLLTLMTVALLATLAPVAHAEMMRISYLISGQGQIQCPTPGPAPGPIGCPNATFPLDITMLGADSNSPGAMLGSTESATLSSSNVDLINTFSSTLQLTIVIYAQGFTIPTGGAFLASNVSGTVLAGNPANTLTFESCIDPMNRAIDTGGLQTGACPAGSIPQPGGVSMPNIAPPGAFSTPTFSGVTVPAGTFALDQIFHFSLAPETELNWSASTAVTSVVPEPTTSILVVGGAGLLGLGARLKRLFQRRVA